MDFNKKKKKKKDRISDLPDEILHHIGSFLSAKEAAFATLLSKRWRTLVTIIPNLHFSGSLKRAGGRFKDFADRVLADWLYLSALASGHSHSNVNMSLGMKTLSTVVSVTW